MESHIKYLLLALVTTFSCSCREIYYTDEIEADEMIPVIQGSIMEGKGPVVILKWANGYNDDTNLPIHDAIVYISEDNNIYALEENKDGYYYSAYSNFLGESGSTYTLHVALPDGREFVSSPQYLQSAPDIDNLYAVPEIRPVYTYNSERELIKIERQGLSIYADLSGENYYYYQSLYFKFKTSVFKQMYYFAGSETEGQYTVYVWTTGRLDNPYTVNHSELMGSGQMLMYHPVGFLEYFYDASLERRTQPRRSGLYIESWVITFIVHSISKDVYDYYKSVEKQLSLSGKVIAPLPSQVRGNMICSNDASAKFIGVFEATASDTVYKVFGWSGIDSYKERELDYFPEGIPDGEKLNFPPSFWAYFN